MWGSSVEYLFLRNAEARQRFLEGAQGARYSPVGPNAVTLGYASDMIGLLFSAMWPFDRLRGYRGLGTVATGLGKLFYHERFRQIAYGQAQVSTPV